MRLRRECLGVASGGTGCNGNGIEEEDDDDPNEVEGGDENDDVIIGI